MPPGRPARWTRARLPAGPPLAFEAATAVAALMPAGLDRVFFTNSGSESVDTALKIALACAARRRPARLIGRERGYHGVGFGGISVGGISPNRKTFSGALLPAVDHLPHPTTWKRTPIPGQAGARTWPKNSNASSRCMTHPPLPP